MIKLLSKAKIQVLILITLTSLVYLNIFQNNFAADDTDFITHWETIRHLENIPKILTTESSHPDHPGVYRPLRTLFLLLGYQLFALNPFWYHFLSLTVHLGATLLVYAIAKRLKCFPFFVGLLFGLHPIHTEAVTFITNSFDSIGLVFYLGAFYFYIKAKSRFGYLASLVLSAAAFFTYEMTLTLPLIILFYDFCFKRKKFSLKNRFYLPYFLLLGGYLFTRVGILQITTRADYLGGNIFLNLLVMVNVFIQYLILLIWPVNLSLNHQIGPFFALSDKDLFNFQSLFLGSVFVWQTALSVVVILGAVALAVKSFRKKPIITFGIGWFFITLIPVANLLPQSEIMSERYLYLASFGFILLLTYLLSQIKKLTAAKLAFLVILIALFLGTRTYFRNQDWKDNLTVWKVLASQNPNDYKANFNLGDLYANDRDYAQAEVYFNKALYLNPELDMARLRLELLPQKYSASQGFSFYYPKNWRVTEKQNEILIDSPNKELTIKISSGESEAQYGQLLKEGLAKIPNFDKGYGKVWNDGGIEKLQLFLSKDSKTLEVLVYPVNSSLIKQFDDIVGSIKWET